MMAKQGRRPRGTGTPGPRGKGTPVRRNKAAPAQRLPPPKAPARKSPPGEDTAAADEEGRAFRLGAVPGATPGRWIDAWKQRMPRVALELVPIDVRAQRAALDDLDAALVRLPLPDDALHVIPLYDEVPVVVASADSHLLAADELTAGDLDGEVLITPLDDVLGPLDLGTVAPAFTPPATTEDAIATVAAGVGIVVVPMSLARLHHRKDTGHRPWHDGPSSTVALAWRRDRTTPDVETFVGIVRGRTPNSSR